MKRWLINLLFLGLAVGSGVQLFVLKYRVLDKEEELKAIHRQILGDSREIHILKADWAFLNDPNRLRALIATQKEFKPIGATQIVDVSELPNRNAPVPRAKPFPSEKDEL